MRTVPTLHRCDGDRVPGRTAIDHLLVFFPSGTPGNPEMVLPPHTPGEQAGSCPGRPARDLLRVFFPSGTTGNPADGAPFPPPRGASGILSQGDWHEPSSWSSFPQERPGTPEMVLPSLPPWEQAGSCPGETGTRPPPGLLSLRNAREPRRWCSLPSDQHP